MGWDDNFDSICPIARALCAVGDRWALLIMRELAMGVRRFEEIQAQTGMASNCLSSRLKQLEEDEIIERRRYSTRPDRYEYHATEKGKELDAVLLAFRTWALKWDSSCAGKEVAAELKYKKTGETIDQNWNIPAGEIFSFENTECSISPALQAERENKRRKFLEAKNK